MSMAPSFMQELLEKIADRISARAVFADDFGYAGFIEFENGHRTFFKGTSFDINGLGSSKIAADKDYAAKFLRRLGYPVPEGILVFAPRYRAKFERSNRDFYDHLDGLEKALEFADESGFPLFVKPNEESEGRGVSRVYDRRQLVDELQLLFHSSDRVLVQRPLAGGDFRVVVLDGEVISAYQRFALQVTGDGASTVRQLVDSRITGLRAGGRGKKIDPADPRIHRELADQGIRFDEIPPAGKLITLLPNANLSTGGEAKDLTASIHATYREFCASVARDMGLALCGVDLIAPDITQPLQQATVLEINSAPGLNNFSTSGSDQAIVVEKLYEKLLFRLRDRAVGTIRPAS
jgi:D-alanine-D-alanine ligase-like ATP-grasp enzyme